MVPVTGLEPVRHRWRRILSPKSTLENNGTMWNPAETYESEKDIDTNVFFGFVVRKQCRAPPFLKIRKISSL